jgi:NADH dehydrogenase (ubiquinone) Fe-S protein 2
MESKMYMHSLPYFDRLDYVSVLVQEHCYCLAIEALLNKNAFNSAFTLVRTLYDELTRMLNHLLAICCHALDVGAMSPVFWGFEEREKIMEFYERVSGARVHAAFYRPNEINLKHISNYLLEDIALFTESCGTTLNEINTILLNNNIWKQRLMAVGAYSMGDAVDYGLTGVMLRSTGVKRDIRLDINETYANYYYLNFKSYYSSNGDSYDRYLLRMSEMFESLYMIGQLVRKLGIQKRTKINKAELLNYHNFSEYSFITNFTSMEQTIRHFKY